MAFDPTKPVPKLYYPNGRLYRCSASDIDLINIPTKHEGRVNIYPSMVHPDETTALAQRPVGCIATVQVEWEE